MAATDKQAITELLESYEQSGSRPDAGRMSQLFPMVYEELRSLAARHLRREPGDHTLQPTALVHEVYLRMVDQTRVKWQGKIHFYAVCAQAMRRILVDHARARKRIKRGRGWQRVTLDPAVSPADDVLDVDLMALHDVLERLASLDERQARIVELRFFGGLTVDEVAHVLGVSKRTIEGDWTHAKAWLREQLD